MPTKLSIIELDMDKLEEILRRVEAQDLHADDYGTIRAAVDAVELSGQARRHLK